MPPESDLASPGILTRWSGRTEAYARFRLPPPLTLILLLKRLSQTPTLERVVDIGCGTGLSTRAWAEHAQEVIGVEPAEEMRHSARAHTPQANLRFVAGFGHDTGLDASSADLVCAASAIHWMEPVSTLREVLRILKPQGLFAFMGPSHPPVSPALVIDQAYFELFRGVARYENLLPPVDRWSWNEISAVIEGQACFALQRYVSLHQSVEWTAEDYLNWLSTVPQLHLLLAQGHTEVQRQFEQLTQTLQAHWGSGAQTCLFVYNARIYQNKRDVAL